MFFKIISIAFFLFLNLNSHANMILKCQAQRNKEKTASETRSLSLVHAHTKEKLNNIIYWRDGQYVEDALKKLNYFLRDHRTGDVPNYDPKVFDILYHLQKKIGNPNAFRVICGYRCQKTNEMLRARTKGVAKKSQHLKAKAIDIQLPGTPLKILRKHALDLKAGGVGYYEKSNFIHVDTGPVRCW